jgi:hypothetical protein
VCLSRARDDLIPAGEPPAFVFSWPDLPIAEFQNARAELSVRRYQSLGGPDRLATREALVYQTPRTQAPAPIVPLLNWPDAVDVTDLDDDPPAALRTAFGLLCSPSSGLPATVGILYGHPMALAADPAETLSAFVPISLAPNLTLTADAAERIAGKIDRWTRDHEPAVVPGRSCAFSLAIYSELDEESRQPLLSLDQLVYRIP